MNYTVYIDEAGDLGCKRGTKWFVLTGVIVDKTKEKSIREIIRHLKSRINVNEIHLRKIVDFNKRAYIVRELNEADFVYINIIIDTDLLQSKNSVFTYNYACRLLLERVSWYVRDNNAQADIILSARGTSRDNELIQYIYSKLLVDTDNNIASNTLKNIRAMHSNERDLLQLADVCATTTFLAYEINAWEIRMPCFFKVLSDHLYKYGQKLDTYGLKYYSNDIKPSSKLLRCDYACKIKERTPGATTTC